MEFHLIDSSGYDLYFPVNPEEVTISREKGIETVNILSFGEFDFPSGEKVKEITFSSFFPKTYESGYCNYPDIPDPMEAMNKLNIMIQAKTPVRFIMTNKPRGTETNPVLRVTVNVLVLVTGHVTNFKGGEPDDIYFELTIRTWREPKVHVKAVAAAKSTGSSKAAATTSRPDTKKTPKTYTVKSGDSLSKIAKLELGNSSKWQAIYNLNKKLIGKDPNKIKPGMKLVMPT
ncbi:LysM peptidoglycan-binding domain-containing protein [Paenibacillus dokdonensis]|uniref:LysM peptidoglycan-binding domain-containing protein n=1 Tax=Paenibacillus dokdonensis TaxID=2567944 RepID=UPI0010A884FD|nr:LysM peptidoglycan-binding domain-containing protein [Paenibacillus dokdonensis]